MLAARSAGCAFSVRLRVLLGTLPREAGDRLAERLVGGGEHGGGGGRGSARARPMPTDWLPWPGNTKANLAHRGSRVGRCCRGRQLHAWLQDLRPNLRRREDPPVTEVAPRPRATLRACTRPRRDPAARLPGQLDARTRRRARAPSRVIARRVRGGPLGAPVVAAGHADPERPPDLRAGRDGPGPVARAGRRLRLAARRAQPRFTQLAALYVLAEGSTTTVADLAEAIGRSPSATSRLVDGLVKRRLVERGARRTTGGSARSAHAARPGRAADGRSGPRGAVPVRRPADADAPSGRSSRWAWRRSRRTRSRGGAGSSGARAARNWRIAGSRAAPVGVRPGVHPSPALSQAVANIRDERYPKDHAGPSAATPNGRRRSPARTAVARPRAAGSRPPRGKGRRPCPSCRPGGGCGTRGTAAARRTCPGGLAVVA